MQPYIANTDRDWFDFLSTRALGQPLDEVNFWQPKGPRPLKNFSPGELVVFRLKKPDYCLAGFGYFAHFAETTIEDAWALFGWRNGADSRARFLSILSRPRGEDLSVESRQAGRIGSTILTHAEFWPESRWVPWGVSEGWHVNLVQGKTETESARVARLLALTDARGLGLPRELAPRFDLVDADRRVRREITAVQREGQGAFKTRLLDAYGRCAISGEKTRPVLDAAHIQSYLGPESNHVQNGILLTKEFHALFDSGYVTVTPDYRVQVSEALRAHWQNGVRYYGFHDQPLRRLPDRADLRPSREALEWHRANVFEQF